MLGCCGAAQTGDGPTGNTPKPQEQARRKSLVAGVTGGPVMKLDDAAAAQVGYYSNHGWACKKNMLGISAKEATPKINQDRLFITPKLCDMDDAWLFGCYDGNGPKGEKVAEAAGLEICGRLEAKKEDLLGQYPKRAFIQAFREANATIIKQRYAEKSGTTATVIYIKGSSVIVANVGDSKAMRATADGNGKWTSEVLSTGHKPDNEGESQRIEACGGYILKEDDLGAARVFDNPDPIGQMIQMSQMDHSGGGMGGMGGAGMGGGMTIIAEPWPGLAMSRVIGHTGVAALGIIPDPDTMSFELTTADRCLVLASDGVWDFVSDEEVTEMCKKLRPDANAACKALVELANQRWLEDDPTYRDDISCCVVYTPLDSKSALAVDTKTISHTMDDATALAEVRAEEEEEAKKSAAAPEVGSSDTGGILGGLFGSPKEGDAAPAAGDAEGKKGGKAKGSDGKVKTTKEQRRRSVVTKFG